MSTDAGGGVASDNGNNKQQLPGFPEFSLEVNIAMSAFMDKIRQFCMSYGFNPLDTRLVEPLKMLDQKGIENNEMFYLGRVSGGCAVDASEKKGEVLVLRVDQTMSFMRYIAKNFRDLPTIFKRYSCGKVYRGEDSRVSMGRFNEFWQIDFDVFCKCTLCWMYESEIIVIVYSVFKKILNIDRFIIRISNIQMLQGLFREFGISNVKKIKRAVKAVDDIMKVSKELTMERLQEAGLTMEKATALLELFQKVNSLPPPAAIEYLKGLNIGNKQFKTGIRELEQVVNGILDNGVCIDNLLIDPRIARGLNYYTGTVCETTLLDMPELGSVCSGGRYNGLMGKLTNNTDDPSQCFGMSIGFTRLIPALINAGAIPATKKTVASVLVTCQDKKCMATYRQIGADLRNSGIATEVYLNKGDKLSKQLSYAAKQGFEFVVIGDMNHEIADGQITIRCMANSTQETISIVDVVKYLQSKLRQ